MRIFIIAMAILYWAFASFAQSLMTTGTICVSEAQFSATWPADGGDVELANNMDEPALVATSAIAQGPDPLSEPADMPMDHTQFTHCTG